MTRLTRWLRAFPHWVPVAMIALAVAFLSMAQCERRRHAGREAELQERLRVLAVERDSLKIAAARTDTQYVADTIAYTRRVNVYRDRVDSIQVHDTVTVREQVIIAAADSAIAACTVALTTCEQRVRDRDALIANERRTRATADSLFRVRLAQANPRLLPFVEAGVNPFDTRQLDARGGLEMRIAGPIRLSGALSYRTLSDTPFSLLVGARVVF